MPYTISQVKYTSSSSSSSDLYATNNTTLGSGYLRRNTLQHCTRFVGMPLSQEQAMAKLERSPHFLQAAQDWSYSNNQKDLIPSAVELDFGWRLRNCLMAAGNYDDESKSKHNKHGFMDHDSME